MTTNGTKAAEAYADSVVRDTLMPANMGEFRLLLAIAFLEGAQWYNLRKLEQAQAELAKIKESHASSR